MSKVRARIIEVTLRMLLPESADDENLQDSIERKGFELYEDYEIMALQVKPKAIISGIYELPQQCDPYGEISTVDIAEAHEALWQYINEHPSFPPTGDWCYHGECENLVKAYLVAGYAICTECGWVDKNDEAFVEPVDSPI